MSVESFLRVQSVTIILTVAIGFVNTLKKYVEQQIRRDVKAYETEGQEGCDMIFVFLSIFLLSNKLLS